MKEGLKRSIYHELATHEVVEAQEYHLDTKTFSHTSYTFGQYRVHYYWDYIHIAKFNPDNNHFVYIDGADWDDDYPINATYEICVAAKNKAAGKPYVDPYKIPAKDAIKDSQKRFAKQMKESAADFLPYDTPQDLRQKIVTQMKQVLTRNLNKHYNAKER